jgi:hypothetical protein
MKSFAFVTAAAALAFAASNASAGRIALSGGLNVGGGGEYTVSILSGDVGRADVGNRFQTFCVEAREGLGFGQFDAEVSSETRNNGGLGPRPLSAGVAYLYTAFRARTLTDYVYDLVGGNARFTQGRREAAFELQRAIWMLQGDRPANPANFYYSLATDAVNSGAWTGLGNVRVLNLRNGPDADPFGNNQDVLTLVPLPGAAATAFAGLIGIAAFRRRR